MDTRQIKELAEMYEFYENLQKKVNEILLENDFKVSHNNEEAHIRRVVFEDEHLVVLDCADEEGFRVTKKVFFKAPWNSCECTVDKFDVPDMQGVAPGLHNMIEDAAAETHGNMIIDETVSVVVNNDRINDLLNNHKNIEPGKLYFYIDNDFRPVRGSLFKVTRIYTCEFTGIEMVGGLEISETGFIINEGIPVFCIIEECPDFD